jgi:translation initiation factor 3 subunit E
MKVIEDPEAVAKLRSGIDKEKNLDLLRSEYNVRQVLYGKLFS